MKGSALDVDSQPGKIVLALRKRKGLKENIPDVSEYYDKL
jgi:elongation factor 2